MSSCYCSTLRSATRKVSALYDEALAPLEINIAQYSLLKKVQRQPVSLTELARAADLDRSTIGRNVRVLERLGLVRSGRGESDHREAVVTLTEPGVEVLSRATPLWRACQKKIEAKLGSEKVQALQDLLGAF